MVTSGPVTATPPDPVADVEITEAHLRSLDHDDLLKLLIENDVTLPEELAAQSTPEIVDWVLANFAE